MNRHLIVSTVAAVLVGSLLGACSRIKEKDPPPQTTATEAAQRDLDLASERAAEAARQASDRAARASDRAAEAARAGPVRMDFRAALGEIAQARCAREARCNNVGEGRRYMSEPACQTVVLNDFARDLNPAECGAGIDRTELDECMRDVRAEDCNNPMDTLSRVAACRTSDLCRTVTVGAR